MRSREIIRNCFCLVAVAAIALPASALEFPKTQLSRKQAVLHLLNRAAYGARPSDLAELEPPGKLESWLENQLKPETIDDTAAIKKAEKLSYVSMMRKNWVELRKDRKTNPALPEVMAKILTQIRYKKVVLAVESERQLAQVMADFWFNHFSASRHTQFLPRYDLNAIRAHTFAKFKVLLSASARDPMTLRYLDNWRNSAPGSKTSSEDRVRLGHEYEPWGFMENYAREILELHTLGVEAGYTQQDVKNSAAALTGWSIGKFGTDPQFAYIDSWHDRRSVKIMGTEFDGSKGEAQGVQLLDFLASHPKTANFLSKKLCRRFEQDPPTEACIKRLTETYLASDGDLPTVYRTLFTSPEFWNAKAAASRIKKPFDFVVSGLRAVDAELDLSEATMAKNELLLKDLGEDLYNCPSPTGFNDENEYWATPRLPTSRATGAAALLEMAKPRLKLKTGILETQLQSVFEASAATIDKVKKTAAKDGNSKALAFMLASPEFQRR